MTLLSHWQKMNGHQLNDYIMNKKTAVHLVQQYIDGWKQNDLDRIIACLTNDCCIIESHGPIYQGIAAVRTWFALWLAANSHIKKWDIKSFYFCTEQQTAFCEWDFACVSHDEEYTLPGISVVKFSANKINFIHEYRMTHDAYPWHGEQLQSD